MHTLTVPKNALRAITLSFAPAAGMEGSTPPLVESLPPSLKRLIVVCEGQDVSGKRHLLEDHFVASPEECVVLNSAKTRWISNTGDKGGAAPV